MTAVGPDGFAGTVQPTAGATGGGSAAYGLTSWPTDSDPAARTDRLLLTCIGGYVVLLASLMAAHGVAVTPDVALVGLALLGLLLVRARAGMTGRLPILARELLPLAALFLAYELMRGYTAAGVGGIHSEDVLALERWLFLGHLPTEVLQDLLHTPGRVDPLAMAATVVYFLHFALPIGVGILLWRRRRSAFHDFIGGLVVLSMAGFATYLVLPVAPPWFAAEAGTLVTADGQPAVTYLKVQGFIDLAAMAGLDGSGAFQFAMHEVNPNLVGAFPSLHAGYPMLAFLVLRRTFGRPAWLMLAYAGVVWLSVVYLADHYVVDILGGIAYAVAAAWLATRARRVPAGE